MEERNRVYYTSTNNRNSRRKVWQIIKNGLQSVMPLCVFTPPQCDLDTPIRRWSLFPHPLSQGWPCDSLWPTECSGSGILWLPSRGLVTSTLTLGTWDQQVVKKPCLAYWRMRDHVEDNQGTQPTGSSTARHVRVAILDPPAPAELLDDCSHTNEWLKTFF